MAQSAAEAISKSQVIIVMVNDGKSVSASLFSQDSQRELKGKTVFVMSTIGSTESVSFAKEVESNGGNYVGERSIVPHVQSALFLEPLLLLLRALSSCWLVGRGRSSMLTARS